MKTVMAFGTFDIFHPGHRHYLSEAKKLGTRLLVVVARDENVLRIKNKAPKNNERDRLEAVEKSGLADKVVLGDLENHYAAIERCRPDVIALGYDQEADMEELRRKIGELGLKTEIIRIGAFHPEKYKSSKLK